MLARVMACVVSGGALCAALAQDVRAQAASAAECMRLLARDSGGSLSERGPSPEFPSLQEAAVRNLTAAPLRAPGARAQRAVSEIVRDAAAGASPLTERLCAALVIERVQEDALLTGYYRPVLQARRTRDGEFRYPLHGLPGPALRGHSRAEIDGGVLDGKAPVVAWLADPVEAFFVHVQGSAVLDLPEGRMTVGYAGSNNRPYTSIGGLLVRQGRMRREEVSMASLKTYLREHPSEREAILHANERYIYFQQTDADAIGSLGVPLTDGRSVAADPDVYPPGTLLFIDTRAESGGVTPRLVFVQDRGSAITGRARLDLYLGTGDEAARVAGPLQQPATVYVLRPR